MIKKFSGLQAAIAASAINSSRELDYAVSATPPSINPPKRYQGEGAPDGAYRLCMRKDVQWKPGDTTINVEFLEQPDARVRRLIKNTMMEWTPDTSIKIVFLEDLPFTLTSGSADIRISFKRGGSWSRIGTDCRKHQGPSMNLDITVATSDVDIRRDTLHEFGHALGFAHEHCSPKCSLILDEAALKNDLPETMSDDIDHNYLKKEDPSKVEASEFDKDSIMCYAIRRWWNTQGFEILQPQTLSVMDSKMVKEFYPPPGDALLNAAHESVLLRNVPLTAAHEAFFWGALRLTLSYHGLFTVVANHAILEVTRTACTAICKGVQQLGTMQGVRHRCDKPICQTRECDECFMRSQALLKQLGRLYDTMLLLLSKRT